MDVIEMKQTQHVLQKTLDLILWNCHNWGAFLFETFIGFFTILELVY